MQTITTLQIRDAFVTQILGINADPGPTFEPYRTVPWNYTPVGRKGGRAMLQAGTRNFDLVLSRMAPNYLWQGGIGTAYEVQVAVATMYCDVEADLLFHMKGEDAVDLRRALHRLVDPQLPGLVAVIPQGIQNETADNQSNVYLEHTFLIHYHQATAN